MKVTEAGQLGDSKVDQAQTNQQVTNAKTETVDNINNIRPIVVKNQQLIMKLMLSLKK